MSWHLPAGSTARAPWSASVVDQLQYAGLQVADLAAGESVSVSAPDREHLVIPLFGSAFRVSSAGQDFDLVGRDSPWAGPTDTLYLPPRTAFTVTASTGGRIAVASAPGLVGQRPLHHQSAASVPIEIRGAGACTREVRGFGMPGSLDADRLLACEVLTPAGNWSSYPPHKHDEDRPGHESRLEEIYYFESHSLPGVSEHGHPHAFHAQAGECAQVSSGDVALVPSGFHGPSMAPPGYDLYYLNVMAGPGPEREWLICDDPAHAWVRDTWAGDRSDPRVLPRRV